MPETTRASSRPSWLSLGTAGPFPGGRTGARFALGAAVVLLLVHGSNALAGGSEVVAKGAFWLLGIGVVAAVGVRAAAVKHEREVWFPVALAFAAWFAGSAYYAGSDRHLETLSTFVAGDMVLLCFAAAAALGAGRLVRARVEPFTPTILLDGMVIAVAVSALGAALMAETLSRLTVEAHPGVMKLAYPIGALLFLSFSAWLVALSDWRPGRFWTLLITGLGIWTFLK